MPFSADMQVFPEDSRGQYINEVDFGLVKADLLANHERSQKDRINVAFKWIRVMLGPLSFKKVNKQCCIWLTQDCLMLHAGRACECSKE